MWADLPSRSQDDPKNCSGTACTRVNDDMYAVDGSRLRYKKSTQTLYMPDGSYYKLVAGEYFDRNGNRMTSSAGVWTDTLGRYQIVLPTGQAYTFNYNAYGEIEKSTLPTGGYERYTYGGKLAVSPASSPYGQANGACTTAT
jgi:hypothetical protein